MLDDRFLDVFPCRLRAAVFSCIPFLVGIDDCANALARNAALRVANDNDILNRGVFSNSVLDLFRIDVLAFAVYDKRFLAAANCDETIFVLRCEVAGLEPFAIERLFCRCVVVVVALHNDRALDLQFTDAHLVLVCEAYFATINRIADRSDLAAVEAGD